MSEFIKNGSSILTRPLGLDYDLIPGKVYNLKYMKGWSEYPYLEENGLLTLPKKVYNEDDLFISRVLNSFENGNNNNLGVLLAGLKGSGKSLTAKILAKKSNLPVLIVDSGFPSGELNSLFTKFTTPVCVIFDETDKNTRYCDTEQMLNFLDGIQTTAKKLVILTCNKTCELSDFILDRCSRIKYFKMYDGISLTIIKDIIKDILKTEN